jgi:hypothetical protein
MALREPQVTGEMASSERASATASLMGRRKHPKMPEGLLDGRTFFGRAWGEADLP